MLLGVVLAFEIRVSFEIQGAFVMTFEMTQMAFVMAFVLTQMAFVMAFEMTQMAFLMALEGTIPFACSVRSEV